MSLRIPLTPDQTMQVEFHEIERRLRKLERQIGKGTGGDTYISVSGGGLTGGRVPSTPTTITEHDMELLLDRVAVLEDAVANLDTSEVPVFKEAGPGAARGIVPSPEAVTPPTGMTAEYLEEDATWSYPYRGLIHIATAGDETIGTDILNVAGALHVAGDLTAADLAVFDLHTYGDIEYCDAFWEDLRFPATGFNPAGSTAPPGVLTTNGLLSFSGTVDNIIGGVAQMPHAWKEGTPISPHIHLVFPTGATANTRWQLEYNIGNVDGDFTTDSVTYTTLPVITVANPNNVARHVLADFDDIPMAGHTISACVLWRLTRLAASDGADDDTNACTFIEFDLHYERDSPGSSLEYTK